MNLNVMRRLVAGWLLILIAFTGCSAPSEKNRPADLVFLSGAVYTMNASQPWAEAVAISGGRIVFVGTDQEAGRRIGAQTTVFRLHGKMLLPGFHDSHVHPVTGGIELGQCDLNGLSTQQEILEKIRLYAAAHPDRTWLTGGGWDLPIFPGANPSKTLLDAIVPDRPVYLTAADAHSAWVNSRALALAGITRDTPDPEEGRIERDPATGEPTGTLRESAMDLVSTHLPELTADDYLDGLRRGLAMAARLGIVSLQEASASESIQQAYAELERRGELTARVVTAMYADPKKFLDQLPDLQARREKYHGPLLRAPAVKIFADGVIEAETAALLEPYRDRPGWRGRLIWPPERLREMAAALDSLGFQIHIHAIGDRAIREALDALEFAQHRNGRRDSRHQIAHLQLIDPADILRFEQLGVIADFQALWAYPDLYITQLTEPKLGPERSRWLYPIGSVAKTGARIAGGSDWSVSSMNPLDAIQVALTRRAIGDTLTPAWLPQERVDLETMLAAYTRNGGFVNHEEEISGSIETGKAADLIVLDHNLFDVPPHEIHRVKVLLTLLAGREVFRDSQF